MVVELALLTRDLPTDGAIWSGFAASLVEPKLFWSLAGPGLLPYDSRGISDLFLPCAWICIDCQRYNLDSSCIVFLYGGKYNCFLCSLEKIYNGYLALSLLPFRTFLEFDLSSLFQIQLILIFLLEWGLELEMWFSKLLLSFFSWTEHWNELFFLPILHEPTFPWELFLAFTSGNNGWWLLEQLSFLLHRKVSPSSRSSSKPFHPHQFFSLSQSHLCCQRL